VLALKTMKWLHEALALSMDCMLGVLVRMMLALLFFSGESNGELVCLLFFVF